MRIELLQSEHIEEYDSYLKNHKEALFYYSSKFKNFLKNLLGCKEEYLLAMENDNICGILPLMYYETEKGKIYNSLPYYGSNGGIIADNSRLSNELLNIYNEIANSKTTLSATMIVNPFSQQDNFEIRHNYTDYRIGQFTNISFQDNHRNEIISRIVSSARRNIKKAIREGVEVEIDHTQIACLRDIHQANIEAIGGISKTGRFFALVPQHFTPGKDFDLYVAKKDGCIIATLLLFYFNQTVEYYTPATLDAYRSIQPLALALITALTDASKRGFSWWNWGGTWGSQTGVYRFKKKWGAIDKKYYYYTQLNDDSILNWSLSRIVKSFPNFFVIPFSELKK